MPQAPVRQAIITSGARDTAHVRRFLPSNYAVTEREDGTLVIAGRDSHGWTLDGYVLPRLASGLIYAREV